MAISKEEAEEILRTVRLPGTLSASFDRAFVLATDTKDARQAIIKDVEHEDRETAAAIEIQRVFRGYLLRSYIFAALHDDLSQTNLGPRSIYKWSDLSYSTTQHSGQTQASSVQIEGSSSSSSTQLEKQSSSSQKDSPSKTNQQEYCALVIQNWWRLKLNEKRRNVRTPPAPPSTTEDNYSTSSVSLSVSSGPPSRAATRLSGQTSTMISAARVIQKAWRRHVDVQVYCYYKDLISFRFRGDPAMLLKCINPKEAELLDQASGTHVKFRLAGTSFPPNIYYKIFTHSHIVDMCANSPKDYTKASAKVLPPRLHHNNDLTRPYSDLDCREGWYERYENNGWRIVSDRVLRKIKEDDITYDSSQKKIDFKHEKLMRKDDLERKRKRRKIDWMKKMYKEGMLVSNPGTETPVVRDIENTLRDITQVTDIKGYEAVDEWEVDELLEWTNGLNFDNYVAGWKEVATSAIAGQSQGKVKTLKEYTRSVAYSR
ncbi:protein MFI-like isoform X2 [Xenia sp. Carnegie-2017]|uniref:protein MFI-like isoform X2 n=1 Tax=Xenia sp. Carnegie-2017 TaxID=2897299 RepID=UPI001F04E966|nr:protein MFI-like isoform X2 [Xenia sp. Carnegie-2017]